MKKTSLPTLKRKADTLISQYIRQKHADHAGYVKCVTCEKVLHWKEAHCAHYMERANYETRWLEENLWPACPSCNVFRKEMHKRRYTIHMIDWYGRDFVDELEQLGRVVCSPSRVRQLAEEAIEFATKALKDL